MSLLKTNKKTAMKTLSIKFNDPKYNQIIDQIGKSSGFLRTQTYLENIDTTKITLVSRNIIDKLIDFIKSFFTSNYFRPKVFTNKYLTNISRNANHTDRKKIMLLAQKVLNLDPSKAAQNSSVNTDVLPIYLNRRLNKPQKKELKQIYKAVYEQIPHIIKYGYINPNGNHVLLDNQLLEEMQKNTCFIEPDSQNKNFIRVQKPQQISIKSDSQNEDIYVQESIANLRKKRLLPNDNTAKVRVVNADSIEYALHLKNTEQCEKPLVLDMANENHPCGGVRHGDLTQEESLGRRTLLGWALDPRENKYLKKVLQWEEQHHYKQLPRNQRFKINPEQVLLIPNVQIFRENEHKNFAFMETVETLDFVAAAAVNLQNRYNNHYKKQNYSEYVNLMQIKLKNIFNAALFNGNDGIVLGALGCGSFGDDNSAEIVADILKNLIEKYRRYFKVIDIAILGTGNTSQTFQGIITG